MKRRRKKKIQLQNRVCRHTLFCDFQDGETDHDDSKEKENHSNRIRNQLSREVKNLQKEPKPQTGLGGESTLPLKNSAHAEKIAES